LFLRTTHIVRIYIVMEKSEEAKPGNGYNAK
jgi:hypothetical protein